MRSLARWFVLGVIALDVVVAVAFLLGGVSALDASSPPPAAEARTDAPEKDAPGDAGTPEDRVVVYSREMIAELGQALAARTAELERREAELDELLRGHDVLARAGLTPEPAAAESRAESEAAEEPPVEDTRGLAAFQTLARAYENMEAESAAKALAELAGRDKQAVVQLLLDWKPRTSGAILDALTQQNPALSADLSYEIWKRAGHAAAWLAEP